MSENPNQNIPLTPEERDASAFDPALYRDFGGATEFDNYEDSHRIDVDDYFGANREDHDRLLAQKEADLTQAQRQKELAEARAAMADLDTDGGYDSTMRQARAIVKDKVTTEENPYGIAAKTDEGKTGPVTADDAVALAEALKSGASEPESAPAPGAGQASAPAPGNTAPEVRSAPEPKAMEEPEPKATTIHVNAPRGRIQTGEPAALPSGRDISPTAVNGFLPQLAPVSFVPQPAGETRRTEGTSAWNEDNRGEPEKEPQTEPENTPDPWDVWNDDNAPASEPAQHAQPEAGSDDYNGDDWLMTTEEYEEKQRAESAAAAPTPQADTELGDFLIDNGSQGAGSSEATSEAEATQAPATDETQQIDMRPAMDMSRPQEIKLTPGIDYKSESSRHTFRKYAETVETPWASVTVGGATKRGLKNETYKDPDTEEPKPFPNQDDGFMDADTLVAGVADGAGGTSAKAGEVAEVAGARFKERWKTHLAYGPIESSEEAVRIMEDVVHEVREAAAAKAAHKEDGAGYADGGSATFVGGIPFESKDGKLQLAHVIIGDSGILVYNKDTHELKQIGREQSGNLPDLGTDKFYYESTIHNWVGANEEGTQVADEFGVTELPENALVIYCTDGILGDNPEDKMFKTGRLKEVIDQNPDLDASELSAAIIRAATKDDDRTVVIQEIHAKAAAEAGIDNPAGVTPENEEDTEPNGPTTSGTGAMTMQPAGATTTATGTMPVPPASNTAPSAPAGSTTSTTGSTFTPANSFDPSNAARVPQIPAAAPAQRPERSTQPTAADFNIFGAAARTPLEEIGTTTVTSATGEQIIVNPGDRQGPRARLGSYANTARTTGLSSEAGDILVPDNSWKARIQRRWNARRAQIEADADAVKADAALHGRHRRTGSNNPDALSFRDRTNARMKRLGNYLTGEDIEESSPDRNRKIAMRQGAALLAGTLALTNIAVGKMAYDALSDMEWGGKSEPSASAPANPGATESPAPETSPSPTETSEDNTRVPVVPPERRQPPSEQSGERTEIRNENGYTIAKNADGSHTITLSHSGTTLWNGIEKGMEAEGLHPTDAVIYDLAGQALQLQGKSWDDAANFHQGSSVKIGTDNSGKPVIKELNIR